MSEKCQQCGHEYSYVYRVPNTVWSRIAPNRESLGSYPEHQYGGLLCIDCAHKNAVSQGISLYFDSSVGGWRDDIARLRRIQAEALEDYRAALGMWLEELPGNPCAFFVEGVTSAADQAGRQAKRLRQQAGELESENETTQK